MGWNQRKKRGEMKLRDLKYLVVRGRGRGSRDGEGERKGKDMKREERNGEKVDGGKVDRETMEGDNELVGTKRKRAADEDVERETQKTEEKEQGELIGFASFMPTYEDGKKVVYVYEIHLEEELRGFVSS